MKQHSNDDITSFLKRHRRQAVKPAIRCVVAVLMIGVIVGVSVWAWTDVTMFSEEFDNPAAACIAHIGASIEYALIACMVAAVISQLFGVADFDGTGYVLPDAELARVATFRIVDGAGHAEIKRLLASQGYLTLAQVDRFLSGEMAERHRQSRLAGTGARMLLN